MVRKEFVVKALAGVSTKGAADALFAELDRIESSNTTRGYIKVVLESLAELPERHTKEGFERLLNDDKWSYKMKRKFQAILDGSDWRFI